MFCQAQSRNSLHHNLTPWLPLTILPVIASLFTYDRAPWIFMWALAISIYGSLKWLSFVSASRTVSATVRRSMAFLLLWPGMDAAAFLNPSKDTDSSSSQEWGPTCGKTTAGLTLIAISISLVRQEPIVAAWIGMTGGLLTMHFGLFHVLSIFWRRKNIAAAPIMNAPMLAVSVSEFWGRRWNLAFRDLAHTFVFRPLIGSLGAVGATLAVFVVSGVVHDVVISVPAGGGFGRPSLYFIIQGFAVLLERSKAGRRIGTGNGIVGRLFCSGVVLGPICLLFHSPFVEMVVVPMLIVIRSIGE